MKNRRLILSSLAGMTGAAALAACGGSGAGGGGDTAKPAETTTAGSTETAGGGTAGGKVGVSMPTQTSERWIADGTNPQSTRYEQKNWFNKKRTGWAVRDPETVPPQLRHIFPSEKLSDGAACIRVAGMVLCELP